LSQVDAARIHAGGGTPADFQEHGKVIVDEFRVLGGVGWGDEMPPNRSDSIMWP
jgi:hypothetical protein